MATIQQLEAKLRAQKGEIRTLQLVQEDRNRTIATHKLLPFVYCNGGCESGVSDPEAVTEELVVELERGIARLRTWLDNREFKNKLREVN